jgi:hypothetical protein
MEYDQLDKYLVQPHYNNNSLDRNDKTASYSLIRQEVIFHMEQWEYRTLTLYLQTVKQGKEKREDYVVTYSDGNSLVGLEMVMRRYLDDGGWDLVSIVPTSFRHNGSQSLLVANTLTVIFKRNFIL